MSVEEGGDTPRASRAQPQRLLLTLLGDFWEPEHGALPSAFLVHLLADVGLSVHNARATVGRLARRGLLEASRQGRFTSYRISDRGATVLRDGYGRIFSFGEARDDWDGRWTVVSFSVPEARRETRHLLRTRLRWHGFAPLHDGVWVAVGDQGRPVADVLDALDIRNATIVVGDVSGPAGGHPVTAWKLEELAEDYCTFLDAYGAVRHRVVAGLVSPAEALRYRATVIDEWRAFRAKDPDLPRELLPADWPRPAARQLFADVIEELGPLAALRVRQLLAPHGEHLSGLVGYRRFEDAGGGPPPLTLQAG
ncbi:PaaX family transcriptional regulator [Blastococcus sp. SYSU D00820]